MAGPTSKKLGPNDKRSCGSDKKAKNAVAHTPIQSSQGEVLPGSAKELASIAAEAAKSGKEDKKAIHFYTMAIDSLAKKIPKDANGMMSDANLLELSKSSEGLLVELLSGRSHVYLRQGDVEAAIEDADTCTRADPAFEKGHLRLAVAYEAAGVSLQHQLEACERGVEGCPVSEILVNRKWRLKKAIASQGETTAPREEKVQPEAWTIENTKSLADDLADHRSALAAADYGKALALGAHGLRKDVDEAERYLRRASDGGVVSAQRDLGILYLETQRPVEAAAELNAAATAGDEEAVSILQQLVAEADAQKAEARAKLKELALSGDLRAAKMLQEFDSVC
eukprot:TRINITY_DN19058_c0_g1_i1.p1 TRINITY_DN19058_c0_g1~~TRINITY_DN19058_c0_g1_i1.p1  ORF type:complete len:339 (+),score=102.42 TRINITY_DN19058_c0_g1_i1:134-1150(+)